MRPKLSSFRLVRKNDGKYRLGVVVGILISLCGTAIIGAELYIRCCTYEDESTWFSKLHTPLYIGGILITTGLLFVCSSVYYKKTGNQMVLVVIAIVLTLTIIFEVGFVYTYFSSDREDFLKDNNNNNNDNSKERQNNNNDNNYNENNEKNGNNDTADKVDEKSDAETNDKENRQNRHGMNDDDYDWIWKKYTTDHSYKKVASKNSRDTNDSELNTIYSRRKTLQLTVIIVGAFEILLLLCSLILSRQQKQQQGKVSYGIFHRDTSEDVLIMNREENSNKSINYSSIQNSNVDTSNPTAPPLENPPAYEDIYINETSYGTKR